MLYGTNELLELCNDFVAEIGDFEEIELNTEFFCYPTTNEIFISVLASANAVKEFMDTLSARTSIDDISEFTWSLLHEVGHCQTWHMMNQRTINHCKHTKRKIERGSIPSVAYYTLTDERIATDWAIRYVEQNHKAVKAFDKMALALLTEFFVSNEVDLGD